MASPYIAEIKMFGGNFAPRGYALCNGQLLSIAQNNALFALLGTTYGGDGQVTFALPNLQGRVPLHPGSGAGLSTYSLGEMGGVEGVTLVQSQLPAHSHTLLASSGAGTATVPANGEVLAGSTARDRIYSSAAPDVAMSPGAIQATGQNLPHPNIQPFLAVNFIIALVGIFPARN